MKSLLEPGAVDHLVERLNRLQPDSTRQWGRMSPNGMLCHLSDFFRFALGQRPVSPAVTFMGRYVLRYLALYAPIPWPKGVRSRPEAEQEGGGTQPVSFEEDRRELILLLRRFAADPPESFPSHPLFGPMTRGQWMRLAGMHADHHLRQFGV